MGDRFYMQQKKAKPGPRRLKKDIVKDIETELNEKIPSLEKMTVAGLNKLLEVVINYVKD